MEEQKLSQGSDRDIKTIFENHKCENSDCIICIEYMRRFNPKRLVDLMIDEDPEVNNA